MTKRLRIIVTIILATLAVLLYGQFFRMSAMPAEISSVQSMSVTERIVEFLERVFSIDLPFNNSREQMNSLDNFVRKSAHFLQYALLGVLVYGIFLTWDKSSFKSALWPFLIVVLLAAADEFHQTFIPGRSGNINDVILDSAGCIFGLLFLRLIYGRLKSYNKKKS